MQTLADLWVKQIINLINIWNWWQIQDFFILPKLLPYHFEANVAKTKYFCHGYCIDRQMINLYDYKPKQLLKICSKFNQRQFSSIFTLLLLGLLFRTRKKNWKQNVANGHRSSSEVAKRTKSTKNVLYCILSS